VTNRPEMKANSGPWGKVGDESSIKVLVGKKIE
jgi:hypothetical protein